MKIKPLGDRVLIAVLETEEKTKSGIVLPDSAKEKKAEGKVIAVGSGKKVTELNLSEGDVVVFGKYAGDEVEYEGKEYKIIKEEEVLAVIK
ncbi:MAG TPA: co-chaperone GroES [Patescibacteria group bacterium]|nr:co-chaperone GroES [Patescibacteria group bacterium]